MTQRLLDLAARHWDQFEGWCRDIDPMDLPMHRFLSFIYAWATHQGDEDSIKKFDRRLFMPPPNVEVVEEGPWSREAEMSAFRGLASELNIKTTGESVRE